MPKIIRRIPLKNFGLFTNTTFTKNTPSYLQDDKPKIITQIANTTTKNLGGQKQLTNNPNAKVNANNPLLKLQRFFIIRPPATIILKRKENVTKQITVIKE